MVRDFQKIAAKGRAAAGGSSGSRTCTCTRADGARCTQPEVSGYLRMLRYFDERAEDDKSKLPGDDLIMS